MDQIEYLCQLPALGARIAGGKDWLDDKKARNKPICSGE